MPAQLSEQAPKDRFQVFVSSSPRSDALPTEISRLQKNLYAEGAHGFIAEIRPFLDTWQQITEGDFRYLQIGEPEGLPPDDVFHALNIAIQQRNISPGLFKYGSMSGPTQFQEAFADHADRRGMYPYPFPPNHVIFTDGGNKMAYNIIAQVTTNPGDDVLVLSPGYPGQFNAAKMTQARMHGIPVHMDNGWSTHADELQAKLQLCKPKRLFLCDPQNPTGGTFDETSIYTIAEYLYTHPQAAAIVDTIYYGHISDPKLYIMLSSIPEISEQVFNVTGTSKILKATGFRGGVLMIPRSQEDVLAATINRINASYACPSPFIATALAEGYKPQLDRWIEQQRVINARKRDLAVAAVGEYSSCLDTNIPPGAFYLMGGVPINGYDFAYLAAKYAGTAVLPGQVFGGGVIDADGLDLGGDTEKKIRISFAGNIEKVIGGIRRLGELSKQIYNLGVDIVEKRIADLKAQYGNEWVQQVDFINIIDVDPFTNLYI